MQPRPAKNPFLLSLLPLLSLLLVLFLVLGAGITACNSTMEASTEVTVERRVEIVTVDVPDWPLGADPAAIWMSDIQANPALDPDVALAAAEVVVAELRAGNARAEGVSDERRPSLVLISVADGRGRHRTIEASGGSLREASERALAATLETTAAHGNIRWIRVDFVNEVHGPFPFETGRPIDMELGLDGLAFGFHDGITILSEQLGVHRIIDDERELDLGRLERFVSTINTGDHLVFDFEQEVIPVFRFRTAAYLSTGAEATLEPLYRNHPRIENSQADAWFQGALRGADYLTRTIDPQGHYNYLYASHTGRALNRYNILRHAGSTYALLEVYEITRDAHQLAAATRALDWLVGQIQPCHLADVAGAPEQSYCLVEHDEVKLGGHGLALVAMAKFTEITGDERYMETMQQLAEWIAVTQVDSGQLAVHLYNVAENATDPEWNVLYYPGEAMLGLLRLHQLDQNPRWVEVAHREARWLMEVRDAGLAFRDLEHDHWLLYALNDLIRLRPDTQLLRHAMRITNAMLDAQHRWSDYPDIVGAWGRTPKSTPTATRTEGLCAAYQMARDFRTDLLALDEIEGGIAMGEIQADIDTGIRLALDFGLRTQIGPALGIFLPDPEYADGGFRNLLHSYPVRIDYVQHNMSAFLCAERELAGGEISNAARPIAVDRTPVPAEGSGAEREEPAGEGPL